MTVFRLTSESYYCTACCCTRLCVFYGRDVRSTNLCGNTMSTSMDNKRDAHRQTCRGYYAIKTFLIIVSSKACLRSSIVCATNKHVPVTADYFPCRASDRLHDHHSSVCAPRFPDNTQHGSRCPQRRKLHTAYKIMLSLDIFSLAFRFLWWLSPGSSINTASWLGSPHVHDTFIRFYH